MSCVPGPYQGSWVLAAIRDVIDENITSFVCRDE
jgi:hypothetical protein